MRPKGWVTQRNRYLKQNQPLKPYYKTRQKDYEAGADALLKALKREASEFIDIWGLPVGDNRKGRFVFIPDEEAILARQAIDGDVAEQIEDLEINREVVK